MATVSRSVLDCLLRVTGLCSESNCSCLWKKSLAHQNYRHLAFYRRQYSNNSGHKNENGGEDYSVKPDLKETSQRPAAPKLDVAMTKYFILKVTATDYSAQSDGPHTTVPVTTYERMNFSSLESQLGSYKVTPLFIRWLPRSLRLAFFNSVLSAARKKGFFDDDFVQEDFYHFGALASMKLAHMVSTGDFAGLKGLIVGDTTWTPAAEGRPDLDVFEDVSPSSADDLVWSGLSKVMIQEHTPQDGIIHITLHTLCRFNAQLKEDCVTAEKVFQIGSKPSKITHLFLKKIACTFQQHYSFDTNYHSDWKASELAQTIDVVPVIIP